MLPGGTEVTLRFPDGSVAKMQVISVIQETPIGGEAETLTAGSPLGLALAGRQSRRHSHLHDAARREPRRAAGREIPDVGRPDSLMATCYNPARRLRPMAQIAASAPADPEDAGVAIHRHRRSLGDRRLRPVSVLLYKLWVCSPIWPRPSASLPALSPPT